MILNGCLALASGVIESYCHHKPASSEVPSWIYKLFLKCRNHKHDKHQVQAENGQEMDSSDSPEMENAASAEDIDEGVGQTSIWKDLASLINRLTLALCVLLTLVSMIAITVQFLLLR